MRLGDLLAFQLRVFVLQAVGAVEGLLPWWDFLSAISNLDIAACRMLACSIFNLSQRGRTPSSFLGSNDGVGGAFTRGEKKQAKYYNATFIEILEFINS